MGLLCQHGGYDGKTGTDKDGLLVLQHHGAQIGQVFPQIIVVSCSLTYS